MALLNRTELPGKIEQFLSDNGPRLFLIFGERYLCRKAVKQLQDGFLQKKHGTVYEIDGDHEDGGQTLAKLLSFSLLPGLQIFHVSDSRLFHSKNISKIIWDKGCRAFKANRPKRAVKYISDMYSLAGIPQEDRQPLADLTVKEWQEMFGMAKPADLDWTTSLLAENQQPAASSSPPSSLTERYMQAFDRGLPPDNILILSAETVDKRKKFFTYFKENGVVIDCSVATGSGAAAQKVQKSILKEMMQKTLAEFGKTIDPRALEIFFERVGFHPVAVVMETEKLALYCNDRAKITLQDLDQMVGRSREDALFELTEHFGKRALGKALATLDHLLGNGVHSLAIISTMRNFIRKLLIFRSIQLQPAHIYHRGMAAKQFQESYLPAIKEKEQWKDLLKGHPYALYMSFSKAAEFKCATLKSWLELILIAEFRLKGSNLPDRIILEQLIITMIRGTPSIKTY